MMLGLVNYQPFYLNEEQLNYQPSKPNIGVAVKQPILGGSK